MRVLPRLVRDGTTIGFFRWRLVAFALSALMIVLSIVFMLTKGLALGIDFKGGTLVEVRTEQTAEIARFRSLLGELDLGDVAIQQAGSARDVMIRIERQDGEDEDQLAAIEVVKAAITEEIGPGVEFLRVEFVGPKVGGELREAGVLAVLISVAGVMAYLWFRFEWQYGVAAIAAVIHDVAATMLVFSLTGLEFNLSSIAAILTIVGYSLNDSVVIFDRIRENLRKFKVMPIDELIDRSLNETLARTLMTSITTLIALTCLYVFGGQVIQGFTFAMIFGVLIGTYSTIYISSPLLYYLNLRPDAADPAEQVPATTTS